jgi:hypothetical protein
VIGRSGADVGLVVGAVAVLGVAGTGLAQAWNAAIVNWWGATNAWR